MLFKNKHSQFPASSADARIELVFCPPWRILSHLCFQVLNPFQILGIKLSSRPDHAKTLQHEWECNLLQG